MSHVSLLPADAVEGAGLPLDDVDVIIKEARFALWNYNNTQAEGPALRVIFVDGEEKSHEQYFSAGKIEKSVPSDDGKKLLPVSDASPKGLNKSTKAFTFLASLFNADPAVGTLLADGDVSKLDGLRAHVIAAADKNDKGETIKNAKGYDRTTIVVSKIIALPGQTPKAAAAGKKAAAGAPAAPAAAAAAGNAELDAKVAEIVLGVLAEQGGTVARLKLSPLVFKAAGKESNKQAIVTRAFQEDFLKANFGYDGTNVSMAA
jgi:hypothetical protein